jgi:predicted Zn-dependent peptidase
MIVYAGTSPEQMLEVINITCVEMLKLKTEPVPPQELMLAKEHLKGNLLLSLESCDNLMTRLAKNEIYFGCHATIEEITSRIEKVTSDSIMQLSNKLFDDNCFTLQVVGKLGDIELNPSIFSF